MPKKIYSECPSEVAIPATKNQRKKEKMEDYDNASEGFDEYDKDGDSGTREDGAEEVPSFAEPDHEQWYYEGYRF